MGLPARRHDTEHRSKKTHLRVVRTSARTRKVSAQQQVLAARRNFRLFATLMSVVAVLGLSRVWLSVEATQASLEAARLRSELRSERYRGDMLEVRQSALGSPSRIRAIAGKAMDMAPAQSITYMDLAPKKKNHRATEVATSSTSSLRRTLASVMDLTAGEAQVLLVGDVGLASTQ